MSSHGHSRAEPRGGGDDPPRDEGRSGLTVVTLYYLDGDSFAPVAVLRLVDGHIAAESITAGTDVIDEWLEGTWDAESDEMVTPDMGERYLKALVNRPMTYARFEPGETDFSAGSRSDRPN